MADRLVVGRWRFAGRNKEKADADAPEAGRERELSEEEGVGMLGGGRRERGK